MKTFFGGAKMMHKNPLLSSQSSLHPVYCYHQTTYTVILTYRLLLSSQYQSQSSSPFACILTVIVTLLLTLYIIWFNGHQITQHST